MSVYLIDSIAENLSTLLAYMQTEKVEKVFLELAEEVIRMNPKTKQEFKKMIREYSYKENNKW
ncbi:hypothetical protein D358_00231 [Enterococcus faecalis RP2S-4]|uniref:Uncharacterized protein n=1 Tax=Enterococcus faecalis RP2S-4 TaxID=1244145 RepID=A0ABC9TPJ8_ENTFL|nr:hypothetical protein D358_00231 [Enterococcus faecalis RP2S-4]